jgi:hypothetical protein
MCSQLSQICSYANINTRFAHPLCAYRNRVTRLKQFAFALWKRVRAWRRCRVTRSSLALMPMASARCTPHSRSNNSSRVRKFLRVLVVLPGHGASISVAPSIHPTPRKRSASATYCELENYVGRQLRHRHLLDRILVRRNGKGLQRSDLFYG